MARKTDLSGRPGSSLAAFALLLAASLMPRLAEAHSATATITCSEVSFFFQFFPPTGINTINETVRVDGTVVKQYTYQFTGSTSSNNLAISVPVGSHTVAVHADWNSNGAKLAYDTSQTITCNCATTTPSMATASASGAAYVGSVVLLGQQVSHSATVASSRTGPGLSASSAGPMGIHLTGPIDIEVLRSTSSSTVTSDGATDESVATAANVNLLNLVTATALRADARAFASPVDARYSFAGSSIEGLSIAGTVVNAIYPNEVIPLPGGGTVTLLEEVATASETGGIAKADLSINLIHVRVGKTEIIVGHAEAHARSPLATQCPNPNGSVSGEAFAARVSQGMNPRLNTIWANHVTIPSIGGNSSVAAQTFQVVRNDGTPIGSGTVSEQVNGILNSAYARATANATVESLCLFATTPCDPAFALYPTDGIALNLATAAANSQAGGGQASSWTAGTSVATIVLAGKLINPTNLPPNTVYTLPGIGTVTINETIPEATNNNTTDNGVTVNLIHVRTLPEGADIIVSSAHSDAHHQ
jgi:hypothetical protein